MRNFEAVEFATLEWVDWFNIAACSSLSAISHPPKPNNDTMPFQTTSPMAAELKQWPPTIPRRFNGTGGVCWKNTMTGVSTMTDMTGRTPWHLWLVGVIAVLFNAIGAFDYVMSMAQGGSYMASAGMTPAQIAHYQEMPIWMIAVWTIGVWGAMLGSVLILLRNKLAFLVFAVSLAAFLVSLIYTYVLTDGGEIMGGQMAIASVVIKALGPFPLVVQCAPC